MDDFPEFHQGVARSESRKTVSAITFTADYVLASSEPLFQQAIALNNETEHVPNAYNSGRLQEAIQKAQPIKIGLTKKRIVYVGTVGKWFDWDSLAIAARSFPQSEFWIIGRVSVVGRSKLSSNVRLFGELDNLNALGLAKECDVGFIPFKVNKLTASVDPIKYYEYRALGLPVVSSDFDSIHYHDDDPSLHLYSPASEQSLLEAMSSALEASKKEIDVPDWGSRFAHSLLIKQFLERFTCA